VPLQQCPSCGSRFRGDVVHCPRDGAKLCNVDDALIGRTVAGRYLIEERIGAGGMGSVYLGRQQVIERAVALKFLHPRLTQDATQRKRFLGEARAANQINHEHVIAITDFGETEDGLIFLVMEYLEGRSLAAEISGRPLEPARAAKIALQVALGLGRAHELDVVHRDVKPANIHLIKRHADPDFVKLLDFGIAHFERDVRITDRGAIVGTPEYMAPEQLRHGESSMASDLYSLGCVLNEMLTGSPPFEGHLAAQMVKHTMESPRVPSSVVASVPRALDDIVLRLLQKSPKDRHRDAFHLIEDLERFLRDAGQGRARLENTVLEAQPRASLRPTIHVPTDEEEWDARIRTMEAAAQRTFGARGVPSSLSANIATMRARLSELSVAKATRAAAERDRTFREDDSRATSARIGRALDELLRDESHTARELDALRTERSRAAVARAQSVDAACRAATAVTGQPMAGVPLEPKEAVRLGELLSAATQLASADKRAHDLDVRFEAGQSRWEDLRFQIAQLKGRLGTLNASAQDDAASSEAAALNLETDIKAQLAELVRGSEVIAIQLRQAQVALPK
jgi:eukaryotic-like serine/threonine-protein kinase